MKAELATWQAPGWAESSSSESGLISHRWTYPGKLSVTAELWPNVFHPVAIEVSQVDVVEAGACARVVRESVEILCGPLTMSPAAALELAAALTATCYRLSFGPAADCGVTA